MQHGFKSASFASSRATSVQRKFIAPIKQQVSIRGLAEGLLPQMRAFTAEPGAANKFVFIYTEGNHFPYKRGYSEAFGKFKPDDHGRTHLEGDVERLVNAYDNAVLYTDAFLASLIEALRDRPAVLVYASDHGDALGDEGNFIRGGVDDQRLPAEDPNVGLGVAPFRGRIPGQGTTVARQRDAAHLA